MTWCMRVVVLAVFWAVCCVAEHEVEKELVTFKFKPGKLGVGATWSTGQVTRVDRGSQAANAGVEIGMKMVSVNKKEYAEAVLDKAIAGKSEYSLTFEKPPPPPKKVDKDMPPKPDFHYATELNPETYAEMVLAVTNSSSPPAKLPYFPMVMFHMSWCKHCRVALPEYEQAAAKVQEAIFAKHLEGYRAPPRLFLLECDVSAEHKAICEQHTDTRYPAIRLFRDKREIVFNRPRLADTFAMWAMRVSRPPLMMLETVAQVEAHADRGVIFLMCAEQERHFTFAKAWEEVGLDNIDAHSLFLMDPNSEVCRSMPAPSVTAKGPGIKPLPFKGDMSYENLKQWVNFNQFAEFEDLHPYLGHAMKESGIPSVVLAFDAKIAAHKEVLKAFKAKAKELRASGKYLFASIDVSLDESQKYLENVFPLLSPVRATFPEVFVFSGPDTYWEQPGLIDPSALSVEGIEALLSSSEARQDDTTMSFIKDRKKRVLRYALGSPLGGAITIGVPVVVGLLLRLCIKTLCESEEQEESSARKKGGKAE